MLIWDCPEVINEWVAGKGGGHAAKGACTALGWVENDRLVAGLVFHEANGAHCLVNIAIANGAFPRALLCAGLHYVFSQLKLKRLTFIIAEGNIPSQNLVRKLGATLEATLRDADINGNLLIYALFPEDCKLWSRINGQVRRCRTFLP
jgi:RimJ/RimL family protein N-acetyltransferase